MKDGIGVFRFLSEYFDRFIRRDDDQLDFSASRLMLYVLHYWKRSEISRANYHAPAFPG
jgi:hypothetical protein